MDILERAKELGYEIMRDERFIKMVQAKELNDADERLQEQIGRFNLLRMNLNNEMSKADSDSDAVSELDREINELYKDIMANGHMAAYAEAKAEVDGFIKQINTIVTYAANGIDPETALSEGGCAGSCAGCAGCGDNN